MRKIMVLTLSFITLAGIALNFTSCGKELKTPPVIYFDTAKAYISADTAILQHTIFTIGVYAEKTGPDGLLNTFSIMRSINGGADSMIQEMNFVQQNFLHYYSYVLGDSGTTERYTFTVGKQDGLTNSVSVAVTAK